MGNSNSSQLEQITTIAHPGRWVSVCFIDDCEILRDTVTGQEVEQSYVHTRFNRTHEQEMQEYLYRSRQRGNIVRVLYADRIDSKNFCVGSDKYKVRTQRIPIRLSQMDHLSSEECLCLLVEALTGFQEIYFYGKKATITDEMIGVSPEGAVKVWVNSHFADNRPQEYGIEIRGRPLVLTEPEVVQQIFMTVQDHAINKELPEKLKQRIEEKMTFSEAIRAVNTFAWQENITIPKKILRSKEKSREESVINYHIKPVSANPAILTNTIQMTRRINEHAVPVDLRQTNKVQQQNSRIVTQSNPQQLSNHFIVANKNRTQTTSNPKYDRTPPKLTAKLPQQSQYKRTAVANTVANIQSRAIILKQQSNQLDSSKRVILLTGQQSKGAANRNIQIQNKQRVSSHINLEPIKQQAYVYKDKKIQSFDFQNLHRSRSEGHFLENSFGIRQNNHLASGFHILSHKNLKPENHTDFRISPHHQSSKDLRKIPSLQKPVQKKQVHIQAKPPLKIPADLIKAPAQVYKIDKNQHQFQLNNSYKQQKLSEQVRQSTDARIFKPEFSFDPKYHVKPTLISSSQKKSFQVVNQSNFKNQKMAVIDECQTVIHSTQKTQVIEPTRSSVMTDSGFLVRNFAPDMSQNLNPSLNPLLKNIRMTKTIEVANADEQKIFLQSKIKQIEEQLKNITYLQSNENTPLKQSMKSSAKNSVIANDQSKRLTHTTIEADSLYISKSGLGKQQKDRLINPKQYWP